MLRSFHAAPPCHGTLWVRLFFVDGRSALCYYGLCNVQLSNTLAMIIRHGMCLRVVNMVGQLRAMDLCFLSRDSSENPRHESPASDFLRFGVAWKSNSLIDVIVRSVCFDVFAHRLR